MLFFRGKGKFSDVAFKGDSWKRAYYKGDLVFLKEDPTPWMTIFWTSGSNKLSHDIRTQEELDALCGTATTNAISIPIRYPEGTISTRSQVVDLIVYNSPTFPTTWPSYFLKGCSNLEPSQDIEFPDNVITIGDQFMYGCNKVNFDIETNNVQTIGSDFLYNGTGNSRFNSTVTLPNVVTINDNFMYRMSTWNNTLNLGTHLVTIGNNFLRDSWNFNQNINIPATVTTIGDHFLSMFTAPVTYSNKYKFNSVITFAGTAITSIGNDFLEYQKVYDKEIDLSSQTNLGSIGDRFMLGCDVYDHNVKLPNTSTGLTIGKWFMMDCTAFSKSINLDSNVTRLGIGFLHGVKGEPTIVVNSTHINDFAASPYDNSDSMVTEGTCVNAVDYGEYSEIIYKYYVSGNTAQAFMDKYVNGLTYDSGAQHNVYARQIELSHWGELTVNDSNSNTTRKINLTNKADVKNLCTSNYSPTSTITLSDGTSIVKNQITDFCFDESMDLTNSDFNNGFLKGCANLNPSKAIKIPNGVTELKDDFLYLSGSLSASVPFNVPIDLNNVTCIGANFLDGCNNFNQPLDVSKILYIENSFLNSCKKFNQPLIFSSLLGSGKYNLGELPMGFLNSCTSFNNTLYFPNNITKIGKYFMRACNAFNKPIDLSNITYINNSFLQDCIAFNQKITLHNNITYIGDNFMNRVLSGTEIECNMSTANIANSATSDPNGYSAGTLCSSNGAYYIISGSSASEFMAKYPNVTSGHYKRDLRTK